MPDPHALLRQPRLAVAQAGGTSGQGRAAMRVSVSNWAICEEFGGPRQAGTWRSNFRSAAQVPDSCRSIGTGHRCRSAWVDTSAKH